MSKRVIDHRIRAIARLYTVLNAQLSNTLLGEPSGSPIGDHDEDGQTVYAPGVPAYYYGMADAVPFATAGGAATFYCFLTVQHVENGVPATGGTTTRREVGRILRLGVYLMFAPQAVTASVPTVGGKTLKVTEWDWYAVQAYSGAVEWTVYRYLANGDDVQHIVELVTNESGRKEAEGDVAEHFFAHLEFDVSVDVDLPQNLFDV
jgi:hypothetical protein